MPIMQHEHTRMTFVSTGPSRAHAIKSERDEIQYRGQRMLVNIQLSVAQKKQKTKQGASSPDQGLLKPPSPANDYLHTPAIHYASLQQLLKQTLLQSIIGETSQLNKMDNLNLL